MKKPKTYLYITFCSIFLFLTIVFFVSSNIKTVYKMTYNEDANINYKVYLKNNNYYDGLYQSEDMGYISNLIDYIDIDYHYNLKTSNKFNITNNYLIKANVIVEDNSKKIYNKSITLKEMKVKDYKTDNIDINENIKINYQEYNRLIEPLLKDNKIADVVRSTLEIELYIINDYDIEKIPNIDLDEKEIKLIIPLSNDTISFTKKYININNEKEVKNVAKKETNNYILFALSMIFLLISTIIFIALLINIKNNDYYKHQYIKVLDNILKKHNKDIVTIKDIPDMRGFDVYDVVSFDELLDTSKILNKPIMYLEIEKNRINLFFVECDNKIYQYLMRTKR